MRVAPFVMAVCAIGVFGVASAPTSKTVQPTAATRATPLILEKAEGERRAWRPIEGHSRLLETG